MVSLTAIIHCKPGTVDTVLKALIDVGAYVKDNEPGTLGYAVIRSTADPTVLLTQERFQDAAAMQAHNEGTGSKTFFTATEGLLANVVVHIGDVMLAG